MPRPEEPPVTASERARVLQEHLVRTAYALHFTAADLAAQHERRADGGIFTAVDHRLHAKRWLALSAHALAIVHRWDPRTVDVTIPVSLPDSREEPLQLRTPQLFESASNAIERVFRASLKLHAVMPLVETVVLEHVHDAVDELDHAIRDIRALVIDTYEQADDADARSLGDAPVT